MTTPSNPPPSFSTIELARKARLLTITLNRPDALNAVNLTMHQELAEKRKPVFGR